ncbi:Serine/threonine-protein phosphatase [Caenorhabditis elegans]|uniref:Serine/threonine-protein phosphatase n=1 Tax=Caenorhabditis elegans TaxID=6239 RepID=O44507_CAEEL|nr:Serine/threonine-protein phosphatase [Caenorhabditis elegans]CCD61407.2 Serine/threonine-protein phosphatase [Caenorhabditis elegans]|eukprot:NP_501356.2 Serine/threonine-protein phosphatase [Caenorhabditis elegans]
MADDKSFDVNMFLKRHLIVKSWANYRQLEYTKSELIQLIDLVTPALKEDNSLAQISPPVTIVGDIHGQFHDLIRILNYNVPKDDAKKKSGYGFCNNRFVFLGDYVDRGSHSIECISLMFALKIIYQTNYILLRGNHETRAINYAYGFREELVNRLGPADGKEVWEKFNEVFAYMPLACLVGEKILCMHGGISPRLNTLEDIKNIDHPLFEIGNDSLAQDLLWADPTDGQGLIAVSQTPAYPKNIVRGLSVVFNEAAVHDTCKRLGIKLIVRAHQMIPEGFKFFADQKLLTIFSAPRYMNETDNHGATLKVETNGRLSIGRLRNMKALHPNVAADEITRGDDMPSGAKVAKKKSNSMTVSASKSSSSSNSHGKGKNKSGSIGTL